ncbi:PREDICTED: dysbindin [Papilio xuthus]|uniref:Dysbindin n=1 Tax=Papilio xuthus TaxID=66420 RepID=A0AAJ7ELK5_PAPXU|nr:PREDICTED: dysbindin [Papilio xuthus]
MLGNLKDFISVVQDGLSSHNNLRQTLQEVHKVTNIFKDKQKVANESKVNYSAGGEILEKYQNDWVDIHANAEKNAKAADEVDKLIKELHGITNTRVKSYKDFSQALSQLPAVTASVAQCADGLRNLKILLHDVEEQMVEFEDMIERRKMEKWKLDHHYQLTLYKEKKMTELEEIRSKLAKENSEQNMERERKRLAELQAKRENSSIAFQKDIAIYLSSGSVPHKLPSSPNITLEQIQLEDDKTDLEKFLDS